MAASTEEQRKSTFDRWNDALVGVGAFPRHHVGRLAYQP